MVNWVGYAKHALSSFGGGDIIKYACFHPWTKRGAPSTVKGYPYIDFFIRRCDYYEEDRLNEEDLRKYFYAASKFPPGRTVFKDVPLLHKSIDRVTYEREWDGISNYLIHAARVSTKFHVNKIILALSPFRNLQEKKRTMPSFLRLCSLGGRPEMVVHLCQNLWWVEKEKGWQFPSMNGHRVGYPHCWTREHVLRLGRGYINMENARRNGYFLSRRTGKDEHTLYNGYGYGYRNLSGIVDSEEDMLSEKEYSSLIKSLEGEFIKRAPAFNSHGHIFSDEQIKDFLIKQGWT